MTSSLRRYMLDIETDTTVNGLDPSVSFVRSIAILGNGSFIAEAPTKDREPTLLLAAFDWINQLEPGVIVTWNGSCFDLPFLGDRIAAWGLGGYVDFDIVADPTIVPKYEPLPGHAGGYRAQRWGGHTHVDVAYAWKAWAEEHDVSWSLKPVAKAHGIPVIEVDRAHIESLSPAELLAYNLSDVYATGELGRLLGDSFEHYLDRHVLAAGSPTV